MNKRDGFLLFVSKIRLQEPKSIFKSVVVVFLKEKAYYMILVDGSHIIISKAKWLSLQIRNKSNQP